MAINDLIGIGLSGLGVSRRSLATTGHNIANVNTPGYTRQRVETSARAAHQLAYGFAGRGVEADAIRRQLDAFAAEQARATGAAAHEAATYLGLADRVDGLFGDSTTGLGAAMTELFSGFDALADDPSSLPAREVVLARAATLVRRFEALDGNLAALDSAVDTGLRAVAKTVGELGARVAELNADIVVAEGTAHGQPANDLRDARDELVRQLGLAVGVDTFEQDDGSLNVMVAGGTTLVAGSRSATLSVVPGELDPTRSRVLVALSGTSIEVTDRLAGGELGAMLDFRDGLLDETRNAVGRLAIGLADELNAQHRLGADLDGDAGGDLLTPVGATAPVVHAHAQNTGSPAADISVAVLDADALTTSNYLLERSGAAYTLTRLSDGASFALPGFPPGPETGVDGLSISLTGGTIASGDRFLIQPTRRAAAGIGLAVGNPRDLAAATPVLASADAANTGQASASPGSVNHPDDRVTFTFTTPATFDVVDETTGATLATGLPYLSGSALAFNGWSTSISGAPAAGDRFTVDNTVTAADAGNAGSASIGAAALAPPDPSLRDPVTITFDDPPSTFTVTGATTGSPAAGIAYTSGAPISFNGWTVELSGTPDAGDRFTIAPPAAGVGDNRNALELAGLRARDLLERGGATFGDAFGQIVSRVGTETRQAGARHAAQATLFEHASAAQAAASGVNLDEEAADILRFQQAYQANARVIAVADELFQTLLGVVGR